MGLAGRHNRCHRPRATSDTIDPDAAKSEAFFHHALALAIMRTFHRRAARREARA